MCKKTLLVFLLLFSIVSLVASSHFYYADGKKIELGFDQKTVADFMTKIEKSKFFTKNVKLNSLKLSTANGVTVQKFALTCTRVGTKK